MDQPPRDDSGAGGDDGTCPQCLGSGEVSGETCPRCDGSGKLTEGIGGG